MISKKEFINSIQKVVIPKMMALQRTQKTSLKHYAQHYIGLFVIAFCMVFFIAVFLPLRGTILNLLQGTGQKTDTDTTIFIVFMPLCMLALITLFVLQCKGRKTYLNDENVQVLKNALLNVLSLSSVKPPRYDWNKFFNEEQLMNPPIKGKLCYQEQCSYAYRDVNASVYACLIDNRDYAFSSLLLEFPLQSFYNEPVVFSIENKDTGGFIYFDEIDDARSVCKTRGINERDIQNLLKKNICEKLVNLQSAPFRDDVWRITASFYHDKLHIFIDITDGLFNGIRFNYKNIKAYETFYDNVVVIEQYCRQFESVQRE